MGGAHGRLLKSSAIGLELVPRDHFRDASKTRDLIAEGTRPIKASRPAQKATAARLGVGDCSDGGGGDDEDVDDEVSDAEASPLDLTAAEASRSPVDTSSR